MNKQEYLRQLRLYLGKLPAQEITDILSDYQEHFAMGIQSGKTEESISESLGNPKTIAQGYQMNSLVHEASSSPSVMVKSKVLLKIMMLIFVLAPLNFFIILGPFLIIFILTLTGWIIPISLAGVGISFLGALLSTGISYALTTYSGLSLLFMFFGTLGISLLGIMIMIPISKLLTQFLIHYLRWNLNFITARKN